ncbi:Golgi resident protein GCP60-like [Lepisosteus oculatus]|uniref:Golgi resident protein GCP60-like n=1 Tax=Lepisosteus oculatus TaxID=7918 RepID=UPI0035F51F1C
MGQGPPARVEHRTETVTVYTCCMCGTTLSPPHVHRHGNIVFCYSCYNQEMSRRSQEEADQRLRQLRLQKEEEGRRKERLERERIMSEHRKRLEEQKKSQEI